MRNLIKLERDLSVCYNVHISEFLDPEYIYLPIRPNYYVLVKNGDTVYKGQVIMENNLNKVICPISGKFAGVKKQNVDGKIVDTIVIANDFKEKEKNYRQNKIAKYDRDSIVAKLYEYYFKYFASIFETKKINNLIISAIDDEPYVQNNSYVLNKYYKEILELIDILSTAFEIARPVVVVKNTDSRNVEKLLSQIGTYPNIKMHLVEDKYLLGKSFFLLEHLGMSEDNSLVIESSQFLDIYFTLKYGRHPLETFITIAGSRLERSQVIKVKIGSSFEEIIKNKFKVKGKDNLFVLNGLMTGLECDIKNTIVSKSTSSLIVTENKLTKEEKCNLCGLCYKICPVKVNPKKVMDSHKISSSCIDCGLCSYVCPSHINLRKYLKGEYE